ncbi:MAG TPA: hypothetical protein VF453_20490, partial [Burkholderiaceae bacterium]
MSQAAFNFASGKRAVKSTARQARAAAPVAARAEGSDPGDAIGFDYARYGLVPPAPCLWPGHPVREGW